MAEKARALHSSTPAWKIPWMEEPGRLQSMESLRVGNNRATSLSLFTCMHWRRKWQPTPVFLPGESQGRWSLVGCCLWGRTVGHDWSDLAAAAAGDSGQLYRFLCYKVVKVGYFWTQWEHSFLSSTVHTVNVLKKSNCHFSYCQCTLLLLHRAQW